MGVTISCLCTRAQDGKGYFDLEQAMVGFIKDPDLGLQMVDFIKDPELGLLSLSFQSLPAEFIQQTGNTYCVCVITTHKVGS